MDWKVLVRFSEEQLSALDVAEVNLACAEGLPGAERINHAECIDRLNHYARSEKDYTERRMLDFYDKAEVYDGSEAKFRIVCMIRLLQRAFGIRYNPAKKPADAPFDAADTFIHGALMGEGGTCASLPVIYAAVGRRLGYPLRLVEAKRHLFVRWDEPGGERFNIEVNDRGADSPPDDYYRKGRYEISPWVEKSFCYLVSQTPRMELAGFLLQRGERWLEIGRYKEAAESFLWADSLAPHNKMYSFAAKQAMEIWKKKMREAMPPNAPEMTVQFPPCRRWPEAIPLGVEHFFMVFEAMEACLKEPRHQEWWEALRRSKGVPPKDMPWKIELRVKS